MQEDLAEIVLLLLREGSTSHAVKLYREATGASREEARSYVDQLAHRHGLRSGRRGWLSLVFLAGAALVAALLTI